MANLQSDRHGVPRRAHELRHAGTAGSVALHSPGLDRRMASTVRIGDLTVNRSPVVLPIPGTADLEHLEENVGAARLILSPAEMRELN